MVKWAAIKDGYNGFEQLAKEYVESEFKFPYGEWKKTQQTRDGNKDAYTIIVGYHPYIDQDETWWMEAKYSAAEKRAYLTRYRLDATIVSSVFHRHISKIIFVTNIDIHSKTISDIRFALQKAIGCQEVYFSTRQVLEYWLAQNPSIYKRYFPGPALPEVNDGTLFVSEEISVYPSAGSQGYIEPCAHIYLEKTYQAYFKGVSGIAREIKLSSARKGVRIEKRKARLLQGETVLYIPFHLTDKFQARPVQQDGRESQPLELFRINGVCPVLAKSALDVLQNMDFRLVIQSQKEILSALSLSIKAFRKHCGMKISILHGESGIGKTHLIHRLMAQPPLRGEYHYYYNLSEDAVDNAKHLLYLTFFLLFPYIDPKEIDTAYLCEIGKQAAVTQDLLRLSEYLNYPAQLENAFQEYCSRRGELFPDACEWKQRYVFLDNSQNLNSTAWNFLLSILREAKRKHCPFFFLFAGQSYMLESDSVRDMQRDNLVEVYHCEMTMADILDNIRHITTFDLSGYAEVLPAYFPNLIVLLSFLKFIHTSGVSELGDLSSFLTLYITFVNRNMSEALVRDQFANIMANPDLKKLCFAIYTAPNGVGIEQGSPSQVFALLESGLVKLDTQNRLVPFHDIYEGIFRRAYHISKRELGLAYMDELDEARDCILFPKAVSDFPRIAAKVTELREAGHFYSVCYILNSFFEQPSSAQKVLKNPPMTDSYYRLYFDYAYATANCSHLHTGYDLFEKIYAEIKDKTSADLRLLKLDVLFELMNSYYNIFRFQEAMRNYQLFQEAIILLIRIHQLPADRMKNEMYILCENMRIMIQSSRGRKKSERMFLRWCETLKQNGYSYSYIYIDFNTRYAHTLYTVDPERAFRYTQEARNHLSKEIPKTSKIWCLVQFQYLYLRILLKQDYSLLPELEEIADSARKNYYSSYRHRNLAICAVLYVIGDTARADERFLKDMANPRHLRDKLRGFYFETMALHYLAHKNPNGAAAALEQAAAVFKDIPDYLRAVRHNQKVLRRGQFSSRRMAFYLGEPLKSGWYYIDPRAD